MVKIRLGRHQLSLTHAHSDRNKAGQHNALCLCSRHPCYVHGSNLLSDPFYPWTFSPWRKSSLLPCLPRTLNKWFHAAADEELHGETVTNRRNLFITTTKTTSTWDFKVKVRRCHWKMIQIKGPCLPFRFIISNSIGLLLMTNNHLFCILNLNLQETIVYPYCICSGWSRYFALKR